MRALRSGYTLLEMAITVIITGILAAMAASSTIFLNQVGTVKEDARTVLTQVTDAKSRAATLSGTAGVTIDLYGSVSTVSPVNGKASVWEAPSWSWTAGSPCPPTTVRLEKNTANTTRQSDGYPRSVVRAVDGSATDRGFNRVIIFFDSLMTLYACQCAVTVVGTTVTEGTCSAVTVGNTAADSLRLRVQYRNATTDTQEKAARTVDVKSSGTFDVL